VAGNPFPRRYGREGEGDDAKALIAATVWCRLAQIEHTRYGCRVLPARWQPGQPEECER
jgi:hypothetical protein